MLWNWSTEWRVPRIFWLFLSSTTTSCAASCAALECTWEKVGSFFEGRTWQVKCVEEMAVCMALTASTDTEEESVFLTSDTEAIPASEPGDVPFAPLGAKSGTL